MKRIASVFAATAILLFGISTTSFAYANGDQIPCEKVGVDPNTADCFWKEGYEGGTWKGYWYTVPKPVSEPKPEPVKEPEKPKFQETCSTTDTSDPKKAWSCINDQGFLVEYRPTVVAETKPQTEVISTTPSSVVATPTVIGSRNNVTTVNSNTVNNISSVQNNTSNVVNNVSAIDNSKRVSSIATNTSNDYRVITVNGGFLIFDAEGAAKFFPASGQKETSVAKEEIVYLDREDLPRSLSRAVDRLPEEMKAKRTTRLPSALRNAESVSEDVCTVEKRRLTALSKGTCVLEIVVGNNIYEHEIEVVK